jgi:hypothetical protein
MTDITTKSLAAEILASTNQPEIVTKTEEQKNVTETKTNDGHLCPICYATMDKIDIFYPDRMAQRILGMGDITTLVERAQADFDEEKAKKLEKKIRKNQFDFDDFKQIFAFL